MGVIIAANFNRLLAQTLQEFFGGELLAIIQPADGEAAAKWASTACKIDGQLFNIHGAMNGESYRSEGVELVAVYGARFSALIPSYRGEPYDQELAARLRAIGRREIHVPAGIEQAPHAIATFEMTS
ncbi:hypothetical protein U2H31_006374 [Pseudomonas aeruginosa]|nr:hypothetical protein [Pseudomonas aeruginosa]